MDPASVVGLVAACASLTKTCATVAKRLHTLAEVFKDAELHILTAAEECENISFAWSNLEGWAQKNVSHLPNQDMLIERFQRSIYAGQLILGALEQDLAKASPKSAGFRRRATFAWHASVLKDHQDRIRGHNAALQLLLQVISLPSQEERVELMSVKGLVFVEADESILSIVPSCQSSRISFRSQAADSDSCSVKSRKSLRYRFFSFENDLFTSYVYKRNYRVNVTEKFQRTDFAVCTDDDTTVREPLSTAPAMSPYESLLIPIRKGDILTKSSRPPSIKAAIVHINQGQWTKAFEHLRGADLMPLFQRGNTVKPHALVRLMHYIFFQDRLLFNIVIQRVAFSAGEAWVQGFHNAFNTGIDTTELMENEATIDWETAENAGRVFDSIVPHGVEEENVLPPPSPLELACASSNFLVVAHILSVNFGTRHFTKTIDVESLINFDAVKSLIRRIDTCDVNHTDALVSIFADLSASPTWTKFQDCPGLSSTLTIFLRLGPGPNATTAFLTRRYPLIHAVIYTLHKSSSTTGRVTAQQLHMIKILILAGAQADVMDTVCWDSGNGAVSMTSLALAAALGEKEIFLYLLGSGAKLFEWSGGAGTIYGGEVNPTMQLRARHVLSSWCFVDSTLFPPGKGLFNIEIGCLPGPDWEFCFKEYRKKAQASFKSCVRNAKAC